MSRMPCAFKVGPADDVFSIEIKAFVMEEKANILLIDDQPAKLLTYEAMLDELPANLIKAYSGMEVLGHLLKTEISVVLMDVCMPALDGFETAQMIHEHPRFQNTPIIFVSGIHVTDLDRLKGGIDMALSIMFRCQSSQSCFEPR